MVALPADQIGSLDGAEPKRGEDVIQTGRHQDAPVPPHRGLILDPGRVYGSARPEDNDTLRGLQLLIQEVIEPFAGRDAPVPKDRSAPGFQRFGELLRRFDVLAEVADERCPP